MPRPLRILSLFVFASHCLMAQLPFLRKDFPVGDSPNPVIIGDFNGDGRPDLATRTWACWLPSGCPTSRAGGIISVLLNAGVGNFNPPLDTVIESDLPLERLFAADLNGDGKLDLVGTEFPGVIRYLPGRGNGTFLPSREIVSGSIAATGDFNGDRITDLLVGRQTGGTRRVEVLLGNGAGFFQTSASIEIPPQSATPRVADFNADGRSDLAVLVTSESQNALQNTLAIYLSQADRTFRAPVNTVLDSGELTDLELGISLSITIADFNRDGRADLATPAGIWLGKGDGNFEPARPYPVAGAPVAAADFTGDGNVDLAFAFTSGSSVLPGRGDGTFLPAVQYTSAWPAGGETIDLNGDRRADVVTAKDNAFSVSLFRTQDEPALLRAVSAASGRAIVAPGSLASFFAPTPAASTEQAGAPPWPTRLGGISLEVRDSAGVTRLAQLTLVSPKQINFLVPAATALGEATLAIVGERGTTAAGAMQVDAVAPAIFTIGEGTRIPAAVGVRVASDGRQTPVPVFMCPPNPGAPCSPARIPLPPAGDPIYLTFFGTGFRGANPVNVVFTINGVRVPVEYAGPQGTPGLDQINIRLLPEVRGRPPLPIGSINITIDGVAAANSGGLFYN